MAQKEREREKKPFIVRKRACLSRTTFNIKFISLLHLCYPSHTLSVCVLYQHTVDGIKSLRAAGWSYVVSRLGFYSFRAFRFGFNRWFLVFVLCVCLIYSLWAASATVDSHGSHGMESDIFSLFLWFVRRITNNRTTDDWMIRAPHFGCSESFRFEGNQTSLIATTKSTFN